MGPGEMTRVDFYKLRRQVQDRFVGSATAQYTPMPILDRKGAPPTQWYWVAGSVACALLLIVLVRIGNGDLDSALSIHSIGFLPIYVLLFGGFVAGLVKAAAIVLQRKRLPFKPGIYAFPWSVIDATSHLFEVYNIVDATSIDGPDGGGNIRITFPKGKSFTFDAKPDRAQQAVAELTKAREDVRRVIAAEDVGEMVTLDPLHEPRFSSPVGPADPYGLFTPAWAKFFYAIGLGAGLVVGTTTFFLRNRSSDNKMYEAANERHDAAAYRQYLVRGQKYREVVTDILLPRAELREAEKAGTVEAIQAYIQAHPSSKIVGEVQVSLRAAMLAELEKAKEKGTLSALQEFAKKYPEHGVGPELKAATHAVYERGLEAYKKKAELKDKATLAFVEKLFDAAERLGPKVEIHFRRRDNGALAKADHQVGKSTYFMGEISYPSKYFGAAKWGPRETDLGKEIVAKIGGGFDPELISFEVGAPILEEAPLPTSVKVPSLFISYAVDWQGHTYNNNVPRGIFCGLVYAYDVTFMLPNGGDKPFHFHTDVFRPAALSILKEEDAVRAPGKPSLEDRVYETMSKEAADTFVTKLSAQFFKK